MKKKIFAGQILSRNLLILAVFFVLFFNLPASFAATEPASVATKKNSSKDSPRSHPVQDIFSTQNAKVEAVADSLVEKTLMAAQQHRVSTITLTGGVAANRTIRETMATKAARLNGMRLVTPPVSLCTDNGVMVAGLGTILLEKGHRAEWDMDAMP